MRLGIKYLTIKWDTHRCPGGGTRPFLILFPTHLLCVAQGMIRIYIRKLKPNIFLWKTFIHFHRFTY